MIFVGLLSLWIFGKDLFGIGAAHAAALGVCGMLIFGVISFESAGGSFVKIIAAIALLGGCSALVGLLMRKN